MSKSIDITKEIGLLKVQIDNAIHEFSKEHEWCKHYSIKQLASSGEFNSKESTLTFNFDLKIFLNR